MEIQELYTSFLPKKVKNDPRSYPAPSNIYLSSNIQQLKLLRMENERKRINAGDSSFTSNNGKTSGLQTPKTKLKDDFKRSQSFNQSPNKNIDLYNGISTRNPSMPFEQYLCQQLVIKNIKLNEENQLTNNPFSNSLLSQINNQKENQYIQQQNNSDYMNKSSRRVSAFQTNKLYQKSFVMFDQTKQKINDDNLLITQIQKSEQDNLYEQNYKGDFDISKRFEDENSFYKNQKQVSSIQREYEDIQILEQKHNDQREKSPISLYLQKFNQQKQITNSYDKYYPHYQTSIKIPQDINPQKKLEDVIGGKMKYYIPSELRNLDPEQYMLQSQKRQNKLAQTFNYQNQNYQKDIQLQQNSEWKQDNLYDAQYQNQNYTGDPFLINNLSYLPSKALSRQNIQRRGKSSILSSRPSKTINQAQQPFSSKVIKPALSIQAHMNKDNIVIPTQQQITVNGEIQKYVIPLQQNYSNALSEIDRIKARRKVLLSKKGEYINNELLPFNQEDSKLNFMNKVQQFRKTPNNELEGLQNNMIQLNIKTQTSDTLKNAYNNDSFTKRSKPLQNK